ncbi:PKD domain-containing protein [Aestuariibaculum suncheonense]|uniref:PKD domain-containing protein n=1 Tax=Aestuariibaculum suncheonense TaxID=1028745 RepID=A0A8J6UG47_9FLAO|nr:PKD domain-containing protein [Aestuariibaculum suncheonense]MBD0834749.1 PKD domain-containing protein [Aestuariibaculum suncheonense]
MKYKVIKLYTLSIMVLLSLVSCSSDEKEIIEPKADFDFSVTKGKVDFVNKSENADLYLWEFDDGVGSVSVINDPSYVYTKPGTYDVAVTLTVTSRETGLESSVTKTISLVDIPATIVIDGDFSDWDTVSYVENVKGEGSLERIKVQGAGDLICIYLEGNSDMSFFMPELAINTDGDYTTGCVKENWWTNTGFDILGSSPVHGLHTHKIGAESWQWQWTFQSDAGVWWFASDKVTLPNGKVALELALSKEEISKFATLSSEGVDFALIDWAPKWNLKGRIPERGTGQTTIHVKF